MVFVVKVDDDGKNYGWKKLKFTYIASTSDLLDFNIVQGPAILQRVENTYPLSTRTFIPKQAQ